MQAKSRVFLSLGSNVGCRRDHLREALAQLEERGMIIHSCSPLYETEPVGTRPQRDFLNLACEAVTGHSPHRLLDKCIAVERSMGRMRKHDKSPRIIDIDILFYASQVIRTPRLKIPHPSLYARRFVLVPMDAIASAFVDPLTGRSIGELLKACPDASAVREIEPQPDWNTDWARYYNLDPYTYESEERKDQRVD